MKIINTKKSPDIFTTLLEELKIKHTKVFSAKYYSEHPYRNSLFGLSKMLSGYQIENQGIRIKNKKEMLSELETPFIAYTGSDFITVTGIYKENIDYLWKDKKISISRDEFISRWSGVVLLAEPDEKSIEPGYGEHRKQELYSAIKYGLLIAAIILLSGLVAFHTQIDTGWNTPASIFINLSGLYICYLLLLKQMHIHSNQADKICSLLIDKSDCNNILDTDAAKIAGFSWSEIGAGYFIANIYVIIFYPPLYSFVVLLNICVLPYTVWSVWYQTFRAKQWCPLCLIVQGILWLLFFVNLLSGRIEIPDFTIRNILLAGCLYSIPVIALNMLTPVFSGYKKQEETTQQINRLKANEEIFKVLLKEKTGYKVDKSDSTILFGNPDAKNLITVVTNPHCNPCANMHKRLENLLKETDNGCCIQYILTSFNTELEDSSRFFMYMYQQLDIKEFLSFLNEWYSYGKNDRERFYRKYTFDRITYISNEFHKHKEWIHKTNITATPTILFNGYRLPDEYVIEDMKYFYDINI
jgi:uncharacterized membrane protein